MGPWRSKTGFILIIVLGILGLLGFLAINLVNRANLSRELSDFHIDSSNSYFLARSGVEHAILKGRPKSSSDFWNLALPEAIQISNQFSGHTPTFNNGYEVTIRDSSAKLNVNDGISAGLSELGAAYQANVIDPWPVLGKVTPDAAGWINLRIRRLLNAYGDAHKYVNDIGLPPWQTPDPLYETPFARTGTAHGDFFVPDNGLKTGLGDRIVSARPAGGFATLETLRGLVDDWGNEFLGRSNFFDQIKPDLTIASWEDDQFFRMSLEFQGWSDDTTVADVDMQFLDSNPPDLRPEEMWIKHPVSTININSASVLVKAAIFGSLAQVEYSCDGLVFDSVEGMTGTGNLSPRDSIGRGGVVFGSSLVLENGVDVVGTSSKNLFMSMHDALILAQAAEDWIGTNGVVNDWSEFTDMLIAVRSTKEPYERAMTGAATSFPVYMPRGAVKFDQTYVEKTLPHVLSTIRCLPGWLGAPIATLRPYVQDGRYNLGLAPPDQTMALRSVEDFVYRVHLPKIMFVPSGLQSIVSIGKFGTLADVARTHLHVNVKSFENRVLRTQKAFESVTDMGLSSANVLIGPEPASVQPSSYLGVVGLRDRVEGSTGLRPKSVAMAFNGDLLERGLGATNYDPQDAGTDPFNYDAQAVGAPVPLPSSCQAGAPTATNKMYLTDSGLEDQNKSLFSWGSDASDLSPFGGVMFSSIDHGPRASKSFTDSLYWRPEVMLGAQTPGTTTLSQSPGQSFGRGIVNFWFRNPSGYQRQDVVRQLFHLKLWQTDRLFHTSHAATKVVTVPYEFHGYLHDEKMHFQHTRLNPGTSLYASGTSSVYGREVGMPTHVGPLPSPLVPNPPLEPADNLRLLSPYVFETNAGMVFKNGRPAIVIEFGGPKAWLNRHAMRKWTGVGPIGSPSYTSTESNQAKATSVKMFRTSRPPGSWNRVNFSWQLEKYQTNPLLLGGGVLNYSDVHYQSGVLNSNADMQMKTFGSSRSSEIDHMMFCFGELVTSYESGKLRFRAKSSGNVPDLYGSEPTYLPVYRLNSLIDNIDVRFGNNGGIEHLTNPALMNMRKFFESNSQTMTKRYDLTLASEGTVPPLEPAWVIDPGLPDGAEILAIGARIYDVPEVGSDNNSPWVEMAATAAVSPVKVDGSDPGLTEPYKSTSWVTYTNLVSDPSLRFELIYRVRDPTGSFYLKDRLSDIPWIKEVFWLYSKSEPTIVSFHRN